MLIGGLAVAAVAAVVQHSVMLSPQDIVAQLVATACVPALKSGESSPALLPGGSKLMSDQAKVEIGYKADAVVYEVPSRDGAVWVELAPHCSVSTAVDSAGESYIGSITDRLVRDGYRLEARKSKREGDNGSTSIEVPFAPNKMLVLFTTYTVGEHSKTDPYFQVSTIKVEKP